MVTTNEYKTDTKTYKAMNLSAWVFVFVILCTFWLYFYNQSIKNTIVSSQTELTQLENDIQKINQDEKVKLYTLIQANKQNLEKYKTLSEVPKIINTFRALTLTYQIAFEWFSYSAWEITTNARAMNDAVSLASTKTQKFFEYFRKKDEHMFSLAFVNFFEWQEQLQFSVKFNVK